MHAGEWEWLAEAHGCILVCPSMVGTDGIFGSGPTGSMLRDEQLILSILGQLSYLYNIDRDNIMITGFSGGGFPVYFVGLRHPDVFSVIAARNCNFNADSVDGWFPPEALNTPVLVYYGENDPGTIKNQSLNAIGYFQRKGFKLATALVPHRGHERTPEYAMKFFIENWRGTPPAFRPLPKSELPFRFRFHHTWR
jgi:poly(3-hydroxybutyrate) depolymerase